MTIMSSAVLMRRGVSRGAALRLSVCLAPVLLTVGCAAFPTLTTIPAQPRDRVAISEDAPFQDGASTDVPRSPATRLSLPGGDSAVPGRLAATDEQIDSVVPDELVGATLSPQTIPQFVSTVFGALIEVPFTMTPDVAMRTELISGGTGGELSKRDLFRLTQQALAQYGIDVYIEGAFVTIGNTDSNSGPNVRRGREPPQSAGRVVQIYTVQTIEVNVLQSLLTDLYADAASARIMLDQASNSLIISGSGRDVAQVVRTVRELDQPRFAGTNVLRLEPIYLTVEAFSSALDQSLTTEGYIVSRQPTIGRAIVMLSFPASNQVLIFAREPELIERAEYWAAVIDRPGSSTEQGSTFVYQVRNTDAQSLGQLAIGQAPTPLQPQQPTGVAGTAPASGSVQTGTAVQAGAAGTFLGGRILTDTVSNRIIFTGTATDYAQLRSLLQTLDTPAPQVVIEVMIAEVTLSDVTRLGINFSGTEVRGDGVLSGGTSGISLGSGGILTTFVGPEFRAALNAEASNNRVNILQRPQLVVRSGGTARFQVGTDVPIITSQRATDTSQNGNGTDVLQSVQYRQTGVILDLKPVVYGDRVDIQISQENSSAGAAPAGISSPTILNRSLTTQIAITDGWTGVLGGLISNSYSKVNGGVPFLKDIPLIGSAFQNNSVEGDRTELLILITPYIVRNDEDMADFADRYASDMNAAFRTGRGWSYTLTPFSLGPNIRGVGLDLPRPGRASDGARAVIREEPVAADLDPTRESAPAENAPVP